MIEGEAEAVMLVQDLINLNVSSLNPWLLIPD